MWERGGAREKGRGKEEGAGSERKGGVAPTAPITAPHLP